jgi:FkbM family methyltransferase
MPSALKKFFYKVYLHFPLNRIVFGLVKKAGLPPYRMRRLMRFRGTFKIKLEQGISVVMMNYGNTIENELFWRGLSGWEPRSTEVWKTLCRQSHTIVDVGANTGLYSLIAGKVNPEAKLYAVEPLDSIHQRLMHNLSLNGVKAEVLKVALSNEDGEGEIYAARTITDTFDQASLNKNNYANKDMLKMTIVKRKLSGILSKQNIGSIDLMKIDVETFEPQVLEGMEHYLALYKPSMLIEILNAEIGHRIEAIVRDLGYSFFLIDERTGLQKVERLKPIGKGNNFLILNPVRHKISGNENK